jgi:hypothetical protein
MIQLGSKVRVVGPGQLEFRGEVVEMDPIRFGSRSMVKIRPDPDPISIAGALAQLDRWVVTTECIEEEPVLPEPPDAPFPRPTRDDADALRILSDQLEELGLDPGAALLRDVAGRIEQDAREREEFTGVRNAYVALIRAMFREFKPGSPAAP